MTTPRRPLDIPAACLPGPPVVGGGLRPAPLARSVFTPIPVGSRTPPPSRRGGPMCPPGHAASRDPSTGEHAGSPLQILLQHPSTPEKPGRDRAPPLRVCRSVQQRWSLTAPPLLWCNYICCRNFVVYHSEVCHAKTRCCSGGGGPPCSGDCRGHEAERHSLPPVFPQKLRQLSRTV